MSQIFNFKRFVQAQFIRLKGPLKIEGTIYEKYKLYTNGKSYISKEFPRFLAEGVLNLENLMWLRICTLMKLSVNTPTH